MPYDSGVVFRITPADVEAIIDFDPAVTDLLPFIAAAEEMVTELCAPVPTYTANRLKIIETWLAAHFVAIRDPRYIEEHIGAASASVMNKVGFNLQLTPYGQQAMLLDTAGGLAYIDQHVAQGKRARASITWLGTRQNRWAAYPWRFFALGTGTLMP